MGSTLEIARLQEIAKLDYLTWPGSHLRASPKVQQVSLAKNLNSVSLSVFATSDETEEIRSI